MKKRLFSILTALTLCLSLLPAAALAASDPENYVFDISEGSVNAFIVHTNTSFVLS